MSFNESQSMAICHQEGPMLVLAGPGSGKTLVITQRTKHLIESCGVAPSEILVITFTKAAAMEMKDRFEKVMDGQKYPVTFGTFHAIYFSILKHAYHFNSSHIIREEERIQFLKDIIGKQDLEIEDEMEFIASITGEISVVKNERIQIDNYYSVNCAESVFRCIYTEYEKKLRMAKRIDFDDMLVYCYELFVERKDILAAWQRKYRYILIDEFQDINGIQYDVIKMLAQPENNLFIVGDDDQSIYRFRGAKPELMLNFTTEFKDAKKVLLDTNYRSVSNVVRGAIKVIQNNTTRFEKEIKAFQGEGKDIEVKQFKNPELEYRAMIEGIQKHKNDGGKFCDIAILFRTNMQPRSLIEQLLAYNIPFHAKDKIPNIYEHWITKNIISYFKMASGKMERSDFLQVMNRPNRYISREIVNATEISIQSFLEAYQDKNWMMERINQLWHDLKLLATMSPYAGINYIRKGIGYELFLEEYALYRKIKVTELVDVLNELQEGAKPYQTFSDWCVHMEQYKMELEQQAKQMNAVKDSVALATFHSSKGLEFKIVMIMDVNEGITPYQKAVLPEDLEEERRMFYVAMTRAKEELYLFSVEERYNKKLEPSRYLGELAISKRELSIGMEVIHTKYGVGIIKGLEVNKITVYFVDSKKILTMNLDFCIQQKLIQLGENIAKVE